MVHMISLREHDPPAFLLESLTNSLLWLDGSLRLRYCNPAAETLLELNGQLAQAEDIGEALPRNSEFLAILERVRETQETLTRRELVFRVGTSELLHAVTVDCTVSPLMDSNQSVELLVELVPLDRHLRISDAARLSLQNSLNRVLVRNLAHEIKNPLGGIGAAAQLLRRKLTQPKLAEYTQVIISEVNRLAALVDSLLGSAQPSRPTELNLHELLDHVAQLSNAAGHSAIRRDYDPSLPELWLDRDQMVQVLLNLANNAREAAGRRGQVIFRTRVLRQFTLNGVRHRLVACADIEDDGPGIPPEIQPRLFTPLVSSKPQGSGLGLSIAQALVNRQGGLIEYHSEPGRTVFSVLLPLETEHANAHV